MMTDVRENFLEKISGNYCEFLGKFGNINNNNNNNNNMIILSIHCKYVGMCVKKKTENLNEQRGK